VTLIAPMRIVSCTDLLALFDNTYLTTFEVGQETQAGHGFLQDVFGF
jgi:hypothetical protein